MALDWRVALPPGQPVDLYARHQIAWAIVAPRLRPGERFLFHWEAFGDAAIVTFRLSGRGRAPARSRLPGEGAMQIEIAATRDDGQRIVPVCEHQLPAWFESRMQARGIAVDDIQTSPIRESVGVKKSEHLIRLPVASIRARYRVLDPVHAWKAFECGVGRGKRFGLGMIRLAA